MGDMLAWRAQYPLPHVSAMYINIHACIVVCDNDNVRTETNNGCATSQWHDFIAFIVFFIFHTQIVFIHFIALLCFLPFLEMSTDFSRFFSGSFELGAGM